MRRYAYHSGFVLLMVLVVLAVCGTILAAAARRCGDQALLAGDARRRLQVKWGMVGCRAVCLPAAERILREAAPAQDEPAVTAWCEVELGAMAFRLIVSDEQSKANVNYLEKRFGREGLAAGIRRLQARSRKALHVNLRPNEPGASPDPLHQPYGSFDQVFTYSHPLELVPAGPGGDSPIHRLTCWGNGRLNFKKAEVPVMRTVFAGLLRQAQLAELVKFRQAHPDCTLEEALRGLELSKKQAIAIRGVLTDMSLCHSLWVTARGPTRNWTRFYVARGGGVSSTEVFAW